MVRRGWAEGSIYRHGSRWRVSVSLGSDAFGKRVRKEWQVRSEEAAKAKLREVQRRLRSGLPAEESRVTVSVYAQEWLMAVKPAVKPSTFSFYRTLAEVHLDDLGHLPLAKVMPSDIRRLIADRLESGYSTRTVRGIVDVLRMILKQGLIDGILTRNVAELVQLPKLEQAEPVHFTAEQARRFLDVAKEDALFALWATALGTGLRRGELLALRWQDVDLDQRTVTVRRSKSAAGVRVIPLHASAVGELQRQRDADHRLGLIWPVRPEVVTRRMALLCAKAGLPYIKFHGLRHTAASLLLDSGVDLAVVQGILGHTRVGMAMHYARAGEAIKRDAVERLGKAIG